MAIDGINNEQSCKKMLVSTCRQHQGDPAKIKQQNGSNQPS
jgi:hypothetical protein